MHKGEKREKYRGRDNSVKKKTRKKGRWHKEGGELRGWEKRQEERKIIRTRKQESTNG
jgi:hypothetical protein